MDISSSGESPFVVATHTCETSATYGVSTRTKRVLLFRPCDANSRIVNISRGPRIHDGAWRGDSKSERLRKRKSVAPPGADPGLSLGGSNIPRALARAKFYVLRPLLT